MSYYMDAAHAKRRISYAILALILIWMAPFIIGWILSGKPELIQYNIANNYCGIPPSCSPDNTTCKQVADQVIRCRNVVINTGYLIQGVVTLFVIYALMKSAADLLRE